MKKVIYFALASFACTLVAFAVKPVDPVVNIVDEARVIYNVEGWYEASTGSSTFSIGSNLHIPEEQRRFLFILLLQYLPPIHLHQLLRT